VGGVGKPNEVEVEELRDTANPTLFQELDLPKGQIPRSVAFSSDDTYLTAGTQEASVVYWKLNKGEYQDPKNFSIGGKDNPVTEVFFFGPILAALSSDRLDFYHVSDGSHDDYTAEDGKMFAYDDVSSGLFPEKVILAIGYTSGTISVFEFNGGKIVYRASSESTKGLLSVDLIGSRLLKATSSSIQKFHVDNFPFWGVWSDEKASPPSSVVGMVVSPDGGTVAVTLQDGSVELYNRKDLTQPQVHTLR
jgi:WD40 repeat protein